MDGGKFPPLIKVHIPKSCSQVDTFTFSLDLVERLGAAHALGEGPDVTMNPEWVAITIGEGWVAAALGADWGCISIAMHPILDNVLSDFLPDWSPLHDDRDSTYLGGQVDGALRPYLERIHAAGYETASSCQGGYVPIAGAALDKWQGHDPDWEPVVTVQDKVWGKKQAHLFVTSGWGHGRGGVTRGEAEMRRYVPDTAVVDEAVRIMNLFAGTGIDARVAADETLSYCILESEHLTDVGAKAWWERVTQILCR